MESPVTDTELRQELDSMILSASGWRKVFAPDGEHGSGPRPSAADTLLAAGMGLVWGKWLIERLGKADSAVLVATDTRPTGPLLAEFLMKGLESTGCRTLYAGIAAAPEAMARCGNDDNIDAFAYVSASHNPLGHNGVKFGLGGGVIGGEDAKDLIARFRTLIGSEGVAKTLTEIAGGPEALSGRGKNIRPAEKKEKTLCLNSYRDFLEEIAGGPGDAESRKETLTALRKALKEQPLGIIADLNGSARCLSADRDWFDSLGVRFAPFNTAPGKIAHAILPEGDSLEPCRRALEKAHSDDPSVLIGYVPDNDGDRGNLVIWDDSTGGARILEAQEVFALSALAELASAAWADGGQFSHGTTAGGASGGKPSGNKASGLSTGEHLPTGTAQTAPRTALVVNGPTSHRVRSIAAAYGAEVHEAEVGEANVVNRAAELRAAGYRVRLLGEGSNGGTITHPAAVRDPLNTVTALLKLLRLPSKPGRPAPFEDWCRRIGKPEVHRNGFGPSDILKTLPPFTTTPASAERALMHIETLSHGDLKTAWEAVFHRQWSLYSKALQETYGFADWIEVNNEGTVSRTGVGDAMRSGAKKGGLKVVFRDVHGEDAGFIWMRGSGTEPVFRVMSEIRGENRGAEQALTAWHRGMVGAADALALGRSFDESEIPAPTGGNH